jgi:hypothetical protein
MVKRQIVTSENGRALEKSWLGRGVLPCRDAPLRRVVVPLDGSRTSEAIVPVVARLARTVRSNSLSVGDGRRSGAPYGTVEA